MAGKFITFEGPEGSGKSTQARRLIERLAGQGIVAQYTREPGGTDIGESIRNLLQHDKAGVALCDRSELLLFAASRAQLMEQVILPALAEGEWVVCDRFIDSTMAYQGFARGMPLATLASINDYAIGGHKPDLTVLLDVNIEVGFARLEARYAETDESADRFEREGLSFHERVRDGYLKLAAKEPERFSVINPEQSIEAVAADIWAAVQPLLG